MKNMPFIWEGGYGVQCSTPNTTNKQKRNAVPCVLRQPVSPSRTDIFSAQNPLYTFDKPALPSPHNTDIREPCVSCRLAETPSSPGRRTFSVRPGGFGRRVSLTTTTLKWTDFWLMRCPFIQKRKWNRLASHFAWPHVTRSTSCLILAKPP